MQRHSFFGLDTTGVCLFVSALILIGVLVSEAKGQTTPPQALTNDDVIKMVQAKLGDAVIVAKIKSSPCKFDTSTDALIKLKQAGVSDAVLQAMTEAVGPATSEPPNPSPVAAAPAGAPKVPDLPSTYGAYYRGNSGWINLEAPVIFEGKAKGVAKTIFDPLPRSHLKNQTIYDGPRAGLRITNDGSSFCLYSPAAKYDAPAAKIVKLEVKNGHRQVDQAMQDILSRKEGYKTSVIREVDVSTISADVLVVTPRSNLEPGEYLLSFGYGKHYEFGVDAPK